VTQALTEGNLLDGAHLLGRSGDIATDPFPHLDDDEGLFASHLAVTFHAPAGRTRAGGRSDHHPRRQPQPKGELPGAGPVLDSPLAVVSGVGTIAVPGPRPTPEP
jgi:hypothetical protein